MSRHLALAVLLSFAVPSPTHAAVYRTPQVPVTGSALQNLLNAQGQTINVATEQQVATGFTGLFLTRPPTHFTVRTFGSHAASLAIFDMAAPSPPPLYLIFPAGAANGWFTEVSFRDSPVRMVVNLFDQNGVFQGSTTILGLGFQFFGLAITGPGGVFYPYDERNPDGGAAHVLAYGGTGPAVGGTWLCGENRTAADGGDFDFADAVFLLETLNVTPVQRTTWGSLKQRFR